MRDMATIWENADGSWSWSAPDSDMRIGHFVDMWDAVADCQYGTFRFVPYESTDEIPADYLWSHPHDNHAN